MDIFSIENVDGVWKFKKKGGDKAVKNSERKEELVQYAKKYLSGKSAALKIYKQDGTLQEEKKFSAS